ncbi:MAG TPA: DUF6049 family protein [Acidimicrobiales bacterium]|nr:DUF6049 family protein [Acidimicrobiales bacterium]
MAPEQEHRPRRPGGVRSAVVAAALAGVLVVGTTGPLRARQAGAAPAPARGGGLVLVRQSPWVGPRAPQQSLVMDLRITGRAPRASLRLSVAVYHHLSTRSQFTETLTGRDLGAVLTHSPALSVSALSTNAQGVTRLTIPVVGDTMPGTGGDWTADLGCTPGSCADVYPVKVSLSSTAGAAVAQLVTYLVYDDPSSTSQPLRFAFVVPLGLAPATAGANGRVAPAAPAAVSRLEDLMGEIQAAGAVPLTLIPDPATATRLQGAGDTRAAATLAALSGTAARQTLAQSYVPVNAAALVDAGLAGELAAQLRRGSDVLAQPGAGFHAAKGMWVATAGLDQATLDQLAPSYGHVVVPAGAVSGPSSRLTVTQPFVLSSGKGASPTAMVSDAGLESHLASARTRDPALAAVDLMADLSLIYYEAPNLEGAGNGPAPRGVVAVAPPAWSPAPTFVSAVLGALQGNPVVTPVTLDELFQQVPVGADGQATTRHPVPTTAGALPAAALREARARQAAFAGAVGGGAAGAAAIDRLGDLLLGAESAVLSPQAQRAAVGGYQAALGHELAGLSVRSDTVRLTAGAANVPLTVVRNTAYPVTVIVRLTSDKLVFPPAGSQGPGALCRAPTVQSSAGRSSFSALCVLDHSTNAVYVNMRARASGDFRIDVSLLSPNGALVLANGHLTVRSMSTSAVAIGLSAGAVVVLLAWWGRTVWRGRWGRRGAHAKGPRAPAS